ncbi:MAG: hypothetical protein Q8880_11515 [Bacteroidota bacterium]|nr:hypothetical protein [Bacteroidota bacterium]
MSFQDYLSTHNSMQEIFNYLFDSSEWIHFSDSTDNSPQIQTYKRGILSKTQKCFVVFIEKEGLKEYSSKINFKNMILTRPKPAITYFLQAMEKLSVEGVLINNFFFIEKEELKKSLETYIYDYYKLVMQSLNRIEDRRMQTFQYMRAFFMLPKVYILRFKGHNNSILVIKNKLENGEMGNDTAFIFDSSDSAQKYVNDNKMDEIDIDIVSFSTDKFISAELNVNIQYIMVNGLQWIPYDEFVKLERVFLTVQ